MGQLAENEIASSIAITHWQESHVLWNAVVSAPWNIIIDTISFVTELHLIPDGGTTTSRMGVYSVIITVVACRVGGLDQIKQVPRAGTRFRGPIST